MDLKEKLNRCLLAAAFSVACSAAFAQPKLCGNVVSASGWTGNIYVDPYGIYSFDASDPSLAVATVAQGRNMNGTGGGVADNQNVYLYDVEFGDDYASGTIYKMSQDDYDSNYFSHVGDMSQVPTALTWDASNNTFYGCFYNIYGNAYEFGVLDIAGGRPSRTKLSTIKERVVAMADNDEGVVYAIGESGKLYTVSEEDGTFTEIGATGVATSDMIQSACYLDGSIYWAAQTGTNKSALYKVDPSTAQSVLVGNFPKGEQFSCLYPFKAAAEDGAPSKIEEVTPNFQGPSLTGSLGFTLPTRTFAGGELEGELTWTVTHDGETIATGKGVPGESVTTNDVTLANDFNDIQVYSSNAIGRSPVYKTSIFVGPDTPQSVSWGEPKLVVDDDRNATVTWPAVTDGINGGYIVPEEVTYRLVRQPGNVEVADKLKATTFTEKLPEKDGLVSYYYEVYSQFMGNEAYGTETNKVLVGSGYEVPFVEQFDDGALDYWTVLDQNSDYMEWWLNSGTVYSQAGYSGGSDDWLISPAIHLVPGKYYKVAFKYWGGLPGYEEYKGSAFEVGFGKGTDPSGFQILGSKKDVIIDEADANVFSAVVKVDEDGHYNFGIHDVSPADGYCLYVDSFAVAEGGTLQVPATIDDFTATADADGGLEVKLAFTAPSLTAEGKPLAYISEIVIRRDGKNVVKKFTSPKPGEQLTFTDTQDNGLTDGLHSYTVTSANDKGESLEAEASVKVGIVTPGSPSELTAKEEADGVHLSWKAPETDADGDPINPDNVTYTITAAKYYTQEYAVVAEGVKGTSFTDTSFDLDGEQTQVFYEVQATNRAGSSEAAISNTFIVGKPYDLPMVEGFSPEYERQSKYLWWIDITQDMNSTSFFRFATGMSSDGDDGCTAFYGAEGLFCNLRSGKINMQEAKKPQMSYDFYVNADLSMYATLTVEYSADLQTWTELDRLEYESLDDPQGEEWRTHTLDLTPCVGLPYVYLRLHGELADDNSAILLDNIKITDGGATGVNSAVADKRPVMSDKGVYSISGQLVGRDASSISNLAPGMYIVGGRKIVVK